MLSILLPALREPECNKALSVCLGCIVDNTSVDYELLLVSRAGPQGVYGAYMDMARRAQGEHILILNTDMFLAPGWAEPMLAAARSDTIVAGVLVECGAVGVSHENILLDFGQLPETFRREEFEKWASSPERSLPAGYGHHAPVIFDRKEFLAFGGYNLKLGEYPHACLDQELWVRWKVSGRKRVRVKSYCYHLQAWSRPGERARKSRRQ